MARNNARRQTSLTVEWWPIDKLKPYPGNPRLISEAAIAKVAQSISRFGWRQPIVVQSRGLIVAGETRWRAGQKLGLAKAPVHRVRGLSADECRAYRLADNRTGEETHWNEDTLIAELSELQLIDTDVMSLGFDAAELETLLGPSEAAEWPELPTGERHPYQKMTFTLHDDQADIVRAALRSADGAGEASANRNANALTAICRWYLEAHGQS